MPSRLSGLKGNTAILVPHGQAIKLLEQIGFLAWLEEAGRPFIPGTGNDAQELATQAAKSAGYYECFTNLVEFEDRFMRTQKKEEDILGTPDYGGIDLAVKQGHMTEEEADELRQQRSTGSIPSR